MYCIKCSFHLITSGIAKQVLDRCVVSNPKRRDPKNEDFEVVFDYSFVEDHRDEHKRWLIYLLNYCKVEGHDYVHVATLFWYQLYMVLPNFLSDNFHFLSHGIT